ncbi:hypothetical protein O0555_21050 [Brevibacillus laterosporus]|uniref:hypothetical protein n=1 Tax=Brevibacillus laterosporus TaxID=1465 RepID=UPI00215CB477|nr:hypothetical protein [Brevibacillus laterosporus]MCR8939791.1 hypothetical protein [Brevibacillus laterosporus]MCZ0842431.1 hypothetical protein [Brevibacillus laterosporus]MCZ0846428.1 hypothetical protein [Brevibacillus laterosporus]
MIGQVYQLQGMQRKVRDIFFKRNVKFARLQCLDERKEPWIVSVDFLDLVAKVRRIS